MLSGSLLFGETWIPGEARIWFLKLKSSCYECQLDILKNASALLRLFLLLFIPPFLQRSGIVSALLRRTPFIIPSHAKDQEHGLSPDNRTTFPSLRPAAGLRAEGEENPSSNTLQVHHLKAQRARRAHLRTCRNGPSDLQECGSSSRQTVFTPCNRQHR